ncbi:MAG: hypothetical protein FWG90_07665 [Oscillospiraceae bacterium]|nr:hypothetical protein [Oscillospiraceae bacterium]
MKKIYIALMILSFSLGGCLEKGDSAVEPLVSVIINGQEIFLHEIDAESDTLINRKVFEDTDTKMEQSIFLPIIESGEMNNASLKDMIKITVNSDAYNSIILYDHLITEEGRSYFNRSIAEHNLNIENKAAVMQIEPHFSRMYSSDFNFLADGSIRGFRLVLMDEAEMLEYAFAVRLD